MALVDFFVAGVQKGGTTSIDRRLRQHPLIQMAHVKEVHHFDDEATDWSAPDHSRLHSMFDWDKDGVLRGEATPIYSYWTPSLHRLREYNPQAKLIIALRHPVYRAFSQWKMARACGEEKLSFSEAIEPAARLRVADAPMGLHGFFSYVERGYYHDQIKRAFQLFPRDKVHVLTTDELWLGPQHSLDAITDFLGLKQPIVWSEEYIVPIDTRGSKTLDPDDLRKLSTWFREDIAATAALTNLDLSNWLSDSYSEPMPKEI